MARPRPREPVPEQVEHRRCTAAQRSRRPGGAPASVPPGPHRGPWDAERATWSDAKRQPPTAVLPPGRGRRLWREHGTRPGGSQRATVVISDGGTAAAAAHAVGGAASSAVWRSRSGCPIGRRVKGRSERGRVRRPLVAPPSVVPTDGGTAPSDWPLPVAAAAGRGHRPLVRFDHPPWPLEDARRRPLSCHRPAGTGQGLPPRRVAARLRAAGQQPRAARWSTPATTNHQPRTVQWLVQLPATPRNGPPPRRFDRDGLARGCGKSKRWAVGAAPPPPRPSSSSSMQNGLDPRTRLPAGVRGVGAGRPTRMPGVPRAGVMAVALIGRLLSPNRWRRSIVSATPWPIERGLPAPGKAVAASSAPS
jgi:hypothetical protein